MARMGWIDEFMTIKVNGVKFHLWVVEEGRSTVVQRRFQPSLAVGDGVSSEGDKETDEYGGMFRDEDESSQSDDAIQLEGKSVVLGCWSPMRK